MIKKEKEEEEEEEKEINGILFVVNLLRNYLTSFST